MWRASTAGDCCMIACVGKACATRVACRPVSMNEASETESLSRVQEASLPKAGLKLKFYLL